MKYTVRRRKTTAVLNGKKELFDFLYNLRVDEGCEEQPKWSDSCWSMCRELEYAGFTVEKGVR